MTPLTTILPTPLTPPRPDPLMEAARALEASFLAEMLMAAGLGAAPDDFGGGAGEDQFTSFLVHEQARALVRAGGIGLSQSIFDALKETSDARPDP